MKETICVIGDGKGVVNIAATNDVPGRVKYLQRGYPRRLRMLLEEPGSKHTAAALRARFRDGRLMGQWFELKGAPGVIRLALADMAAAGHDHDPSEREWAKGCRHEDCIRARSGYLDELAARHRGDDYYDGRAGNRPANRPLLDPASVPDPELDRVVDAEPAVVPAASTEGVVVVVEDVVDQVLDPDVVADEAPPAPAGPEFSAEDEKAVAAYLKSRSMPSGLVVRAAADINHIAVVNSLVPDQVGAVIRAMLKDGRLVPRGEDVYLRNAR